jgi:CHAT domain-containing protein/Tfp pilus assembly protein PilF
MVLFVSASFLIAQSSKADKLSQAERLLNEGDHLQSQRSKESLEKALQTFELARQLFHSIKKRSREAFTLASMGEVYYSLGDTHNALVYYRRAIPLYESYEQFNVAFALKHIATIYKESGNRREALEYYEKALSLFRTSYFFDGEGPTLIGIGDTYDELGEKQKALDSYTQALASFGISDKRDRANTLSRLGKLYIESGEQQKAFESLTNALSLAQSISARQIEVAVLALFGKFYLDLGKENKALAHYVKALEISKDLNDQKAVASLLTGMGLTQEKMDLPSNALESYAQALATFHALGDRHGEAYVQNNIGAIQGYLGKNDVALVHYKKALSLFREIMDLQGQALTLSNIGTAYNELHETEKAVASLTQGLAQYQMLSDHAGEASALYSLAVSDEAQGKLADATKRIEAAISIIESLRAKIANSEMRSSYFATVQRYYRFCIALRMQLHRQSPNAGHDRLALQINERARARALLDTLAESKADIRQGVDARLVGRESALQQQLNAKAFQQIQLHARPDNKAPAKVIDEEVESLTDELQQVKTEIKLSSPHYAALTQPQPLSLKQIQSEVLDHDTLLLEYSLGKEQSYLWAVTPNSVNSYELPGRAEIHAAVSLLLNLVEARNRRIDGEQKDHWQARVTRADREIPAAAASLSRMVLAPAAEQLGQKRLIIVADGGLQYIPFAVLPGPKTPSGDERQRANKTDEGSYQGAKPLIVEHEIVSLDSVSTLAVIRREVAGRQAAPKTVAVLADPVFMKNDVRVKGQPGSKDNSGKESPRQGESVKELELVETLESTGTASGGQYFPRLPGTRKEAEDIVAMVAPSERMLALDFAASLETSTSDTLRQYRYVHLSTHGVLNDVNPELSGLVFSLVDENGKSREGFLRMHQIFNLKLPVEVVVLSACQTGIGKEIIGEGLVSLTRGFMYAGAPRVVVSLWSVSEWGTTELMVRFYRGMLKEGLRPAAALRAAQLSLMKEQRWSSPFYWAPFVLQGEWR